SRPPAGRPWLSARFLWCCWMGVTEHHSHLRRQPPGAVDTTDVVQGEELCTAARPPRTHRSRPLDSTCACRSERTVTPDQHAEGGRGYFSRSEAGDPPHTPDDQEWRAPRALGTE